MYMYCNLLAVNTDVEAVLVVTTVGLLMCWKGAVLTATGVCVLSCSWTCSGCRCWPRAGRHLSLASCASASTFSVNTSDVSSTVEPPTSRSLSYFRCRVTTRRAWRRVRRLRSATKVGALRSCANRSSTNTAKKSAVVASSEPATKVTRTSRSVEFTFENHST